MKKAMACLVALYVIGPSLAGDPVIKGFSAAQFEKILKEDLKKDFEKQQNAQGSLYDVKDTPYFVFVNEKGKFINYYVNFKAPGVTLAKINEWNQRAIYSRAFLFDNGARLELPLSFEVGVTRAMVRAYYQFLEAETKAFGDFIK